MYTIYLIVFIKIEKQLFYEKILYTRYFIFLSLQLTNLKKILVFTQHVQFRSMAIFILIIRPLSIIKNIKSYLGTVLNSFFELGILASAYFSK